MNQSGLEHWIDDIGLSEILHSPAVTRLKGVRFLGTMPYVLELKEHASRYDHSLAVAALVSSLCERMGASEETQKIAVSMALLHDIGHLPFSHGSEVFFRETWGKYHTGHSSRLMQHLSRYLASRDQAETAFAVQAARRMLGTKGANSAKSFEQVLLHEMFEGVLSMDKLDGITRAARAIGLATPTAESILDGFFRDGDTLHVSIEEAPLLEEFFQLERTVYNDYVFSAAGLSAEAMLTRALALTFPTCTDKNDFLTLDDASAEDRMRQNPAASQLMGALEQRELFASLKETNSEKHEEFARLLTGADEHAGTSAAARRAAEAALAGALGIGDPSSVIVHSTIRRLFVQMPQQEELFASSMTLQELSRHHPSSKRFEPITDAFFPKEGREHVAGMALPERLDVAPEPPDPEAAAESRRGSQEKHIGAYMTPARIAQFLTDWALRHPSDEVLDPSAGEGVFLVAAGKRLQSLGADPARIAEQIHGVERDERYLLSSLKWFEETIGFQFGGMSKADFFDVWQEFSANGLDAVVGNPPYIRGHRFGSVQKMRAITAAAAAGVELSQRISSWAPFLVCSAALLKPDGRLGMVLPAELLTADYAKPVRDFLERRFSSRVLVRFRGFVFASTQQDVVLLLASQDGPSGLRQIEVKTPDDLKADIVGSAFPVGHSREWLDHRWTAALTSPGVVELLETLRAGEHLVPFGSLASVSLGHVTGANKFFILSDATAQRERIVADWLTRAIASAAAVPGAVFGRADYGRLRASGADCYMLSIPPGARVDDDPDLMAFLEKGRQNGVDRSYKCRNRWPWYSVPMSPTPHGFLTYMSGETVRLVLNRAQVRNTNTLHSVRFDGMDETTKRAVTTLFYSSVTALSAELLGRAYGGGVLKLELADARRLLVPNPKLFTHDVLGQLSDMLPDLDTAVRSGKNHDLLQRLDEIVFGQLLEPSQSDMARQLREERKRLQERRRFRQ